MGDFNAAPDSNAVHMMREVLTDTDPQELPTWSTNKDGCHVCGISGVTVKLDYIFIDKNLKHGDFIVDYLEASDHLPVHVDLNV